MDVDEDVDMDAGAKKKRALQEARLRQLLGKERDKGEVLEKVEAARKKLDSQGGAKAKGQDQGHSPFSTFLAQVPYAEWNWDQLVKAFSAAPNSKNNGKNAFLQLLGAFPNFFII